nr:MAG TPA: hypothetical protein [Caudoviricetes sp.]
MAACICGRFFYFLFLKKLPCTIAKCLLSLRYGS